MYRLPDVLEAWCQMVFRILAAALTLTIASSFARAQAPAPAPPPVASASIETVDTTDQLLAALGRGARTILLRPGTYGDLVIDNARPDAPVKIAAADVKARPSFNNIVITNSRNLAFENLALLPSATTAEAPVLVLVRRSAAVSFARSGFGVPSEKLDNRSQGLLIEDSDQVRVSDSSFDAIWAGISLRNSRHVSVEHNAFRRLGTVAVLMAQVSDVAVVSNRFSGFSTDALGSTWFVQALTRGTTEPTRNVTIQHNVMIQDTQPPAHGIVVSNEARIPFERLAVLDNVVVSGTNNGIAVNRASDVRVERNIVLDWRGATITTGIRIVGVAGGDVNSNHAVSYGLIDSQNLLTRRNTMTPRREIRSRNVQLDRVDAGLAGTGTGRVHADRFITQEHRAAGPRP
jgi:hypothetical protein